MKALNSASCERRFSELTMLAEDETRGKVLVIGRDEIIPARREAWRTWSSERVATAVLCCRRMMPVGSVRCLG